MSPGQQAGTSFSLSRSLRLFVYPRQGQQATQQVLDEGECFAWARTQTGIDPLALPNAAAQQAAQARAAESNDAAGAGAKGAVAGTAGGAVAGTAIGAIAGDTGKGAAIGASAGLLKGARQARMARQQQAAAAPTPPPAQPQRDMFNRAFGACLEGRGYTVK